MIGGFVVHLYAVCMLLPILTTVVIKAERERARVPCRDRKVDKKGDNMGDRGGRDHFFW